MAGEFQFTRTIGLAAAFIAVAAAAVRAETKPGPGLAPEKKVIGLVLTSFAPAVYQTGDGKAECPEGLHIVNRENWQRQFPTTEEQEAFLRRRVALGPGAPGGSLPNLFFLNRGPDGENVAFNPTLVKDQPLREVQSKIGYGLDLDGMQGPEDFSTPDGVVGIDNQMYRLYGCSSGWRIGGFNVGYHGTQFRQRSLNRWLIEISDVDDALNDDHVVVTVAKGIDAIVTDANLKPIAGLTHRRDTRFPKYTSTTTGRIVQGVLTTEPVDHHYTLFEMTSDGKRLLRGMRLNLTLTEKGASGMIAGYEDLEQWWWSYSQSYAELADSIGLWSPPAMFEAAHRLADGFPDPDTGKNTAISTAYNVEGVHAFIVSPSPSDPLLKQTLLSTNRTVR